MKGGITRQLITGERMMIAHVRLKKGDEVPTHSHENEQITYILEGALHFWLGPKGDREVTVRAGEVLVIPSNLEHRAVALEETLDVDVFNPPRQDWLERNGRLPAPLMRKTRQRASAAGDKDTRPVASPIRWRRIPACCSRSACAASRMTPPSINGMCSPPGQRALIMKRNPS